MSSIFIEKARRGIVVILFPSPLFLLSDLNRVYFLSIFLTFLCATLSLCIELFVIKDISKKYESFIFFVASVVVYFAGFAYLQGVVFLYCFLLLLSVSALLLMFYAQDLDE